MLGSEVRKTLTSRPYRLTWRKTELVVWSCGVSSSQAVWNYQLWKQSHPLSLLVKVHNVGRYWHYPWAAAEARDPVPHMMRSSSESANGWMSHASHHWSMRGLALAVEKSCWESFIRGWWSLTDGVKRNESWLWWEGENHSGRYCNSLYKVMMVAQNREIWVKVVASDNTSTHTPDDACLVKN